MIERSHLVILREVDRRGSLTAAADALCLTQPALSHAIRKLEQQLNLSLWTKEGRNLRLTQAGQYLLEVGQEILSKLEAVEQTLEGFSAGRRGKLRIGMECHPCYEWLLRVVSPFLRQWPDVDLDVRQRFQFSGLAALRNHEIDALITPDPVQHPALCFEPVFDYELKLVVGCDHPLAMNAFVRPVDLLEQHLITYPVAKDRLDIYTQFLLPADIRPVSEQPIETTEIMLELVAAGRGVSAIPGWLAERYARELPISVVRLGREGLHKQIFVGIRLADRTVDYLDRFIDLCRLGAGRPA
jgi:LysR family transcriptional regulator, regulator for metE and metH